MVCSSFLCMCSTPSRHSFANNNHFSGPRSPSPPYAAAIITGDDDDGICISIAMCSDCSSLGCWLAQRHGAAKNIEARGQKEEKEAFFSGCWVRQIWGRKKEEKERGENSPLRTRHQSSNISMAKSNVIVNKIEETRHHGASLSEGQSE